MKKLSTSVSPFLMMIVPVILFVGLSIAFKGETIDNPENFSSVSTPVKTPTVLVQAGGQSVIKFLLKK